MISDDFLAAIAATVDRYLSRAGRKPGVPAEQDHAKAAEVVRRYYEEWGDGAQEELRCLLHDLGHSREAIDALLHAAEQPRAATPPAEVKPLHDVPPTERAAADAAIRAATAYTQALDDDEATPGEVAVARRRWHDARTAYRAATDSTPQAQVTPQQAAGARPLPTREQGADDARETALRLERESKCPEATLAALLAGEDATHVDDGSIRSEFERVRGEYQEALRRIENGEPRSRPAECSPQADEALRTRAERAEAERDVALRALEAERRVLRIEMNAPLLGDIVPPTGMEWRVNGHDVQVLCSAEPSALCRFQACVDNDGRGGWLWWKGGMNMRHTATRVETRAEAIDAAHAALTAQRSDDTARDDSGSAAGEGEVTP